MIENLSLKPQGFKIDTSSQKSLRDLMFSQKNGAICWFNLVDMYDEETLSALLNLLQNRAPL